MTQLSPEIKPSDQIPNLDSKSVPPRRSLRKLIFVAALAGVLSGGAAAAPQADTQQETGFGVPGVFSITTNRYCHSRGPKVIGPCFEVTNWNLFGRTIRQTTRVTQGS